ncbi:MAG TPA: helix-turn-helix domain-containing protein [Rubrobacter sp.]|nr:helix-turn-helix domain-containing protein [Rubrobacter sp.]
MATRQMTMREAADLLGVSKGAIRKRVGRGTLPSEMGEDGRRYVYIEAGRDIVAAKVPTREHDV